MKTVALVAFAAAFGIAQAEFLRDLQTAVNRGTNLTAAAFTAANSACTNATNCGYGYCCGYFYNVLPTQHDAVAAPTSNWTNVTATFAGQCTPSEFNASSWQYNNTNVAFQCISPWTTIRTLVGDLPDWNTGAYGKQCSKNSECGADECCGARGYLLNGQRDKQDDSKWCISKNLTSSRALFWSVTNAQATPFIGGANWNTQVTATCIADEVVSSAFSLFSSIIVVAFTSFAIFF